MDDQTEFEAAIQTAVERQLNPVRFGMGEKILLWVLLVLVVVGTAASVLTLVVTV